MYILISNTYNSIALDVSNQSPDTIFQLTQLLTNASVVRVSTNYRNQITDIKPVDQDDSSIVLQFISHETFKNAYKEPVIEEDV